MQGGNLADARAGEAQQADQGQRESVIADRQAGCCPPHGDPVGRGQCSRRSRHDIDAIHPTKGVVVRAPDRIQEKGQADQGAVDRGGGTAGAQQVRPVVAGVLRRHIGYRGEGRWSTGPLQSSDEAVHVARVTGDAG